MARNGEKTSKKELKLNKENNERTKPVSLYWLNVRNNKKEKAGVAFYQEQYGEFLLRIDKEPDEKRYYLKVTDSADDRINYQMDQVLKKPDGSFRKRQQVGKGYKTHLTEGLVLIQYANHIDDTIFLALDLEENLVA